MCICLYMADMWRKYFRFCFFHPNGQVKNRISLTLFFISSNGFALRFCFVFVFLAFSLKKQIGATTTNPFSYLSTCRRKTKTEVPLCSFSFRIWTNRKSDVVHFIFFKFIFSLSLLFFRFSVKNKSKPSHLKVFLFAYLQEKSENACTHAFVFLPQMDK